LVMTDTINKELIDKAISRAMRETFVGSIKTYNQAYEPMCELIDNDNTLTQAEKDEAKIMPCVIDFLQDEATRWTSGNEQIDRSILEAQIRTPLPGRIPEWIPYVYFSNIREKGAGGFSTIYTAHLMRGIYKKWNKKTRKLERSENKEEVILKKFTGGIELNLDELKNHLHFTSISPKLVWGLGITYDPTDDSYMLVLSKMKCNLQEYIEEHSTISWKYINKILWALISGIYQLHFNVNLVHCDLHPKNILMSYSSAWYISDLGISGSLDKTNKVNRVYAHTGQDHFITRSTIEKTNEFQNSSLYYTSDFILCHTEGLSDMELPRFSDDQLAYFLKDPISSEQKEDQLVINQISSEQKEVQDSGNTHGDTKPNEESKVTPKQKLLTRLFRGIARLFQKVIRIKKT
ncbi:3793_t:CDS:2, partial [Acaulospora morrowiae]